MVFLEKDTNDTSVRWWQGNMEDIEFKTFPYH